MVKSLHYLKSMTCILSLLLIIPIQRLKAQDYLISFTATGESKTLTMVKIENLTQGTSLEMNGNDVLHLLGTATGIETVNDNEKGKISFYPHPMKDYSRIHFVLPEPGETMISLFDISGRKIFQTQDLLSQGQHTYLIEGVKEGVYFVRVSSGRYINSGMLISSGSQNHSAKIVYESSGETEDTEVSHEKQGDVKGTNAETVMQYNDGDRLKFTGISGSYSTVVLDIPSTSKTITFDFLSCTDRDRNNYAVVKIGNQIWMAENLRTKTYNNGDSIVTTTPVTLDITNETSPRYQWAYNGDENNVAAYGRLYTWHTITDSRTICPTGWYVPTDDEWTTMTDYLTNNGFGYEGSGDDIAKSMAAESGWTLSSVPGHAGYDQASNNSSGFSASPGGYRDWEGPFAVLGKNGLWFTSSEYDNVDAWYRMMYYNKSGITKGPVGKIAGLSVRCIKGQPRKIEEAFPGIQGELQDYIIDGDTITVEKIDDKYVWQGDIILTKEQLTPDSIKGAGINSFIRRWFCTVYYKINSNLEYRRKTILAAINHIRASTSVDFMEWTDPEMKIKNYVEFVWDDTSCMSNLGMIGGEQYIWIPDWARTGEVIHEIGHTIGLIHEHQRSDRNDFVQVIEGNIIPNPDIIEVNFKPVKTKYKTYPFDFNSIMLYHSWAFSQNGLPTIIKKDGGTIPGNRVTLSWGDIEVINEIYKPDTIKDINGNVYSTITIGKQIWMKENLRTTRYNDGEAIPYWPPLEFKYDSVLFTPWYSDGHYGGLYNWYSVSTGKLCPKGWHVPTREEFKWLIDTLGGEVIAGATLKESGTTHWNSPNTGATNETCFTALPDWSTMGGYHRVSGVWGDYWTSTESDNVSDYWGRSAYDLVMRSEETFATFGSHMPKASLLSIRCIKDQKAP